MEAGRANMREEKILSELDENDKKIEVEKKSGEIKKKWNKIKDFMKEEFLKDTKAQDCKSGKKIIRNLIQIWTNIAIKIYL